MDEKCLSRLETCGRIISVSGRKNDSPTDLPGAGREIAAIKSHHFQRKFTRCAACPRKATHRGMCAKHYYRWRVNGDPAKVYRPWGRIKEERRNGE